MIRQEFEDLPAAYFVSFSEKCDDLSQYRAYAAAGSGYCLGFSTKDIVKRLDRYPFAGGKLFEFVKINYSTAEQERAFSCLLKLAWTRASEIAGYPYANRQSVYHQLSLSCLHVAYQMSNYFKQEGFSDEEEWRIVPTPFGAPRSLNLTPYLNVRRRDNLFVPYLQIDLGDSEGRLPCLREIWPGPTLPFDLAEMSLLILLAKYNVASDKSCIAIKRSATALQ